MNNDWLPQGDTIHGLNITTSHIGGGGLPVGSAPPRFVVHTTEGYGNPRAVAQQLANKGADVHIVADLRTGDVLQCIPLTRGAYGLRNLPGGVQTNTVGICVQMECIRFAKDGALWSQKELDRLAAILWMVDHRVHMGRRTPQPGGFKDPHRMTFNQWNRFKGVCGHVHVPEQDHWDPGKINFPKVQATMRSLDRHK